MSSRSWSLLLSLAFIWGASFYFIEIGLIYLDPFWLVSVRLLFGALPLALWLLFQEKTLPIKLRFWTSVMIMGVLNNFLPFNFIAFGQLYVTGGMASIVNANTAFMGVIVSGLFLSGEPATWNRIVGVMIGVTGVAVAIGITPMLPPVEADDLLLGSLAIILATIAYAFAGVWGKIKLTEYSPTQSAVGMLICSSVISVLCSFLISGPPSLTIINHPFDLIKVVLGLGVLGTALAYPLYFRILEVAGSSNLMLVTIIVPVFAIILDAILLSQFVAGSDLFGFALVAIGLFIMDGRLNYNLLRRR
ncbi:DMT family transporter [Alphaproteobacteria bacterium]|nr:DMT family transporter [Alphaproteobacteria bacterium]